MTKKVFPIITMTAAAIFSINAHARLIVNEAYVATGDQFKLEAVHNIKKNGDVYVGILPAGKTIAESIFDNFGTAVTPTLANVDLSTSHFIYNLTIPAGYPAGGYNFFEIVTIPGGNPLDVNDWINGFDSIDIVRAHLDNPHSLIFDTDRNGFADDDKNRDGFSDDDINLDGFHDDDRNRDGFHDDDRNRDGFHDDDRNRDGFHDSDRNHDGFYDYDLNRDGFRDRFQTQDGSNDGVQIQDGSNDGVQTQDGSNDGVQTQDGFNDGAQTHGGFNDGVQTQDGFNDGVQTQGGFQIDNQNHDRNHEGGGERADNNNDL